MPLPTLNLPPCQLEIRPDEDSRRGGVEVFDSLRKKWVALTPEEWVRQNFVHFLIQHRAVPMAFMTNELALTLNGTARRADTMIYTRALKPLCVVEYKAPHIAITQKVFDQIARYNSVIAAPFLIVSNGLQHYCCRYTHEGYKFLQDIPHYPSMVSFSTSE